MPEEANIRRDFYFLFKKAATKKTHPYKEVQQPITMAKQIPPNKKFLKKSKISGHNKK
jgi:hypothetical protein